MKLISVIARDLRVQESLLADALKNARVHVKQLKIKKRNGRFRIAHHPAKKTKLIQYWLIEHVLSDLRIHKCATAYKPGCSARDNALKHANNQFFLKLDFKNFFPSIKFSDFYPVLRRWHTEKHMEWPLSHHAKTLIRQTCFYLEDSLAIGYPVSPVISNAVMWEFDCRVTALLEANKNKLGRVTYTRYADDLVFSTNTQNVGHILLSKVSKLIEDMKSPKLQLNKAKTAITSRTAGSAYVTGFRIAQKGSVTLHRKYKDQLRLLLSLQKRGRLKKEEISVLVGHLAYVECADPKFYTKLQMKHHDTIYKIIPKEIDRSIKPDPLLN